MQTLMSAKALILVLALLSLSACTQISNDIPATSSPGIRVDTAVAKVGEPVQVTLRQHFELSSSSSVPSATVNDFRLGTCFSTGASVPLGGTCEENLPLPSSLTMLGGSSYTEVFSGVVVDRGYSAEVEHTFTFTSKKPQTLKLSVVYQVLNSEGNFVTEKQAGSAYITFR